MVDAAAVRDVLVPGGAPGQDVQRLIGLANEADGPDNVACVVADVVAVPGG